MHQAKAKRISLYLGNGTLDGLVNISETDGWDLGGELFSCPIDNISELLKDDIIDNRSGVYLLLSSNRVYVGQAVDLKARTKQHLLDKDWWERIVILTSDRNGLNQSFITYLESQLIKRAIECGTSDVENKTKGNKGTLSTFDATLLDQYLDEAYFVLELIGISVFKKGTKTNKKALLPPIVNSSQKQIELRAKKEVSLFLEEKGISVGKRFSYAKLQENKNLFWINPRVDFLKEDWTLILNNQISKKIYVLNIPKNTFTYPLGNGRNSLAVRQDLPFRLDLNIEDGSLVDKRSKLSFKGYVKTELKY